MKNKTNTREWEKEFEEMWKEVLSCGVADPIKLISFIKKVEDTTRTETLREVEEGLWKRGRYELIDDKLLEIVIRNARVKHKDPIKRDVLAKVYVKAILEEFITTLLNQVTNKEKK